MPVLVVESPAKARTIGKYLGSDYKVLATYGHIRDLVRKDGSVDTENGFRMDWRNLPDKERHIAAITAACKNDTTLILATDRDREGEAIGWHLTEVLKAKRGKALPDDVRRITFDAITRNSINEALANPGKINRELVEAYLTRTALDFLVGFGISPLLWRRFPVGKSAGRVQSVCLRLIADRETEIERFKSKEYWSVTAALAKTGTAERTFNARLVSLDGKKLGKQAIGDSGSAEDARRRIEGATLAVDSVQEKPEARSPAPPFITATMQQAAIRALGMSARQAMQAAQKLYEAGLITYMRTDSTNMTPEASAEARRIIKSRFGEAYSLASQRVYKGKVRNAQEAHECIRPSSFGLTPEQLRNRDRDQHRLYELIWKRSIASQMKNSEYLTTRVIITSERGDVELASNGRVLVFDGYQKVMADDQRGLDGADEELTDSDALKELTQGNRVNVHDVQTKQHFTKPPARYTEASIVREMVRLGIGRPSTYASILSTIQDRGYVRQSKRNLIPTIAGRLATVFLGEYFSKYVDYTYTASLEEELDAISLGSTDRLNVLNAFWDQFSLDINHVWDQSMGDVKSRITTLSLPILNGNGMDESDTADLSCPECQKGTLVLRFSRKGGEPFLGCTSWPDCKYLSNIGKPVETVLEGGSEYSDNVPTVTIKHGRYGPYIESGTQRVSIPGDIRPDEVDQDLALQLLSLPRTICAGEGLTEPIIARLGRYGPYISQGKQNAKVRSTRDLFTLDATAARNLLARNIPSRTKGRTLGEGSEMISVQSGRYGPYLKYGGSNFKIPQDVNPETLTHEAALEIINNNQARNKSTKLGQHPKGGDILVRTGPYGPYVNWKRVNASIPSEQDPAELTLDSALKLLAAKAKSRRGK